MSFNLNKKDSFNLTKPDGQSLSKIYLGLGWSTARPEKKGSFLGNLFGSMEQNPAPVDLDASCLMFDKAGNLLETIYFGNLHNSNRSVSHSGDNRTGAGDGDDEVLTVNLADIQPANVHTLVFTINSFTGQSFDRVSSAYCRVVDATTKTELAKFSLSEKGSHTALIMAKVTRGDNGVWSVTALGEQASGRTFRDLVPAIKRAI